MVLCEEGIKAALSIFNSDTMFGAKARTESTLRDVIEAYLLAQQPAAAILTNGYMELQLDTQKLSVHGVNVPLSGTEFKLLRYLMKNAGQVVRTRQLLSAVWGPGAADRVQYARVYITQLRKKLEVDAHHPGIIITHYDIGYEMVKL